MNNKNIDNSKIKNTTEYSVEDLQKQIQELTAKLNWYEEQYKLSKQKQFGASSEKTAVNQTSLFNEAEQESDLKKPEPVLEEITYKRRKKVGKREELLKEFQLK